MSKLAITLILFGTAAYIWQQTEAKPFFFLPPNFFVLTTRAPNTDTRASSSVSSSSSYGGDFQIPTAIISKKINFITNLLTILGGGGAGGSIGGGCGFGVSFNGPTSTTKPKTTTAPDAVFEIESSTKATTNSEKATTTSTEPSVADKDVKATTTTDDLVNNEKESATTSTEKTNIDKEVKATTAVGDFEKDSTTTTAAPISTENEQTKIRTTTELVASATPNNAESESTTSKPTYLFGATTEATLEDKFSINIQPTVVPQQPAIIKTTTKSNFDDITNTVEPPTDKVSSASAISSDAGNVSGGFEVITLGGNDETGRVNTSNGKVSSVGGTNTNTGNISGANDKTQSEGTLTLHKSGAIGGPNSVFKAGGELGYNYQPTTGEFARSRLEIENEILGGNVRNVYLPAA